MQAGVVFPRHTVYRPRITLCVRSPSVWLFSLSLRVLIILKSPRHLLCRMPLCLRRLLTKRPRSYISGSNTTEVHPTGHTLSTGLFTGHVHLDQLKWRLPGFPTAKLISKYFVLFIDKYSCFLQVKLSNYVKHPVLFH